jgi:hypothetical protein
MKRIVLLLLLIVGLGYALQAQSMKSIFTGFNLDGWMAPEGNIWWTADNDILTATSGPDKKGSILWTSKEYKDYSVQLDFKFGKGTVDSGIFLRDEELQIQIGESGSLKRDMTASPYIPGKGYPVEAYGVKDLLKMDDWNTMKVVHKGYICTVSLNGREVMTYLHDSPLTKGPIGLQLHPNRDMSIEFRNISVGKAP